MESKAAVGTGWSEAPCRMLWHRYRLEDDGSIAEARIVPPTSQNQARIERDLPQLRSVHQLLDAFPQARCAQDVIG